MNELPHENPPRTSRLVSPGSFDHQIASSYSSRLVFRAIRRESKALYIGRYSDMILPRATPLAGKGSSLHDRQRDQFCDLSGDAGAVHDIHHTTHVFVGIRLFFRES